jgi:phenylpropionate dioxygenase-like ring-hydroxylating dioxygenase large terminal subunit
MLSKEQNEALYKVGPGTVMGELLRRYWQPIAAVAELDENPIKPMRLMGEDLVLYKDQSANFGLVDRHCPHRRADMSYGWVEECGIRCNYHGWKFDESGACVHQPFEEIAHPDARFKDRIEIKAYPVEAKGGLLWTYMGPPNEKPLLPDWEPFSRENAFVQIVISDVPCNWLECQENSIDPVHFEWLHDTWSQILTPRPGAPYWYAPLKDESTDRWITSRVVNQDFVAWVGQGTVADRTQEHLGESDRGVILLRRRLLEEAAKVQRGEQPKGIIRDPAQNRCVMLPTSGYAQLTCGMPRREAKVRMDRFRQVLGIGDYFPFFAGQPEAVRREFLDAMGFEDELGAYQPRTAVAADN